MPRILGIKPARSTCMCEEEILVAAGVARRAGILLEIFDGSEANRLMRAHFATAHPKHRYEPM